MYILTVLLLKSRSEYSDEIIHGLSDSVTAMSCVRINEIGNAKTLPITDSCDEDREKSKFSCSKSHNPVREKQCAIELVNGCHPK